MKMKTIELTGTALDWAVSVAQGYDYDISEQGEVLTGDTIPVVDGYYAGCHEDELYRPSRDWVQGGPIIDRERITIRYWSNVPTAHAYMPFKGANLYEGETALIAAMRCFVASKLGDEIDVPEELLK